MWCTVHGSFHASLLCVHNPNDDQCFPGFQLDQLLAFNDTPHEWAVDQITNHHGNGRSTLFELKWKSGDTSWVPYADISHLEALGAYLELCGVPRITDLPTGTGTPPDDPELWSALIGVTTRRHSSLYKMKCHSSPLQQ